MSLKNKIIAGVSWSAAERVVGQVCQLAVTVLLARLLSPDDFGLIAIVLVFIAVSQSLIDSGLSSALIQKSGRDDLDFSTVFHFNVVFGASIFAILFTLAPWISELYGEPELESLLRVLALSPVIQGLSIIQLTKLTIEVDFKAIAKLSLVSIFVSSSVAVYLASIGVGVWALAVQLLLNNVIYTILLWVFVDWKPKLVFSISSFFGLFQFGWKLLVSGLLHSIYINAYNLAIGFKHSTADLGFFNQASVISRFPSIGFMAVVSRAVFPIQCDMQNDDDLLKESFKNYLRLSHFLIFPLMFGMAILSEPLIRIVLTEKWLPMSSYFSILCIAYAFTPVMVANNQMMLVKGRSDLFLTAEIIKKVAGSIVLVVTLTYGVEVICLGFLVYNILDALISIFYSKKATGIGYSEQFRWIYKTTVSAFCMLVVVYFSSSLFSHDLLKIVFGFIFGMTLYCYICHLFKTNLLTKIAHIGHL
jgi:teichuronic acid exporter